MKASRWIALAVIALGLPIARGDLVPVTMTYHTQVDKTAVFRIDLTGFDIGTIRSVTVTDGNVQRGTGEIFSGFDLDFLVFDRDGDLSTTDDQIAPLRDMSFVVAGLVRPAPNGKVYYPPAPGPLFGLDAAGDLDHDKATLDTLDADYDVDLTKNLLDVDSCEGWVSLGDDGMLAAGFPLVSIGSSESMFLFIGEVGPPPTAGDPDELSTASVEIQAFAVGSKYVPGFELAQGQSVNLKGDDDGGEEVASWRWDLDGDGQYDDAIGPMLGLSFDDLFLLFGVDFGEHTIGLQRLTEAGQEDSREEFNIQLVPDPATWALLLAVGGPMVLRRRRRRA